MVGACFQLMYLSVPQIIVFVKFLTPTERAHKENETVFRKPFETTACAKASAGKLTLGGTRPRPSYLKDQSIYIRL